MTKGETLVCCRTRSDLYDIFSLQKETKKKTKSEKKIKVR